MTAVFLSAVSEMAIVPESECRMPTLIGDLSCANRIDGPERVTTEPVAAAALRKDRRWVVGVLGTEGFEEFEWVMKSLEY
jgi:hypothetical protein